MDLYWSIRPDQFSFPVGLRAYQRLLTSLVIAIPRFDWSSFCWLRRTRGLFGRTLVRFGRWQAIARTEERPVPVRLALHC